LENFAQRYEMLRRYKGIKVKEARQAMLNPNYYGAMMVAMHQADGFVSGASEITGSTLRAALSNHSKWPRKPPPLRAA